MTWPRAERALNLFLSGVRYGPGAYLAAYLLERHGWDEASIGAALSAAAMAGLPAQTPVGVLLGGLRAKRALVAGPRRWSRPPACPSRPRRASGP